MENTAINDTEVDLDGEKVEDTLATLNKYIEDSDFDLEKERVKKLLKEVYLEALRSRVMYILSLVGHEGEGVCRH